MASIRPFRGVRYNPDHVGEVSHVVSQPYDRVRHGLQSGYYGLSSYNIVRIVKGREQPDDDHENNVYSRARETYEKWLNQGVLVRERIPSMYVLRQTFSVPGGATRTRQGLIAAFRLACFDEGIVLPHEQTHSGPKLDRLQLLRATQVNFGQIVMLYPGGAINELATAAIGGAEGYALRELFERDVEQRFWPIADPVVIQAIVEQMAPRRHLIIADGHHRYETALAYRDEARRRYPGEPPDAAFNFRMVTFVSMEDPGLVILPTHRLIHSYAGLDGAAARQRAAAYFELEPAASYEAVLEALADVDDARPQFALYDGTYTVLTLRTPQIMADLLPDRAPAWRLLDVTVVQELLVERTLGIDKATVDRADKISYLRDAQAGIRAVDRGEAQFLILLNATRMSQVRECTAAGERMPQKSTDFYPKVITGLVAMPIRPQDRI